MVSLSRIVPLLALLLIVGCTGSAPTPVPTAAGPSTAAAGPASPAVSPPAAPAKPASPSPSPSPSPLPSPSPSPVPLAQIRLGSTPSLGAWQVDVAEQKGFFAAQGIGIQQQREDTLNVVEALTARNRDVGVVAVEGLVRAVKDGQSLVLVAGGVNKAAYTLVAARDVDEVGDLKGKPVGVRASNDVTAALARRMLRPRGLADADLNLVGFPDPRVRAAAVANGTAGASVLDPGPAARLQAAGFAGLIAGPEAARELQVEGIAVRPDWARQNEEALVRFLRAIVQANRWIYTPANRAEAVQILGGTLRITAAEADRVYEQWIEVTPAVPREGEFDQPGLRAIVDLLAEVEAIRAPLPDPTRLGDQTFVTRARTPGR